jgi:2-isopropylmalate synthase
LTSVLDTAVEKIKIYDTTLRDGMQAEGISFSLEDKLAIARVLDEFGVDYIEGGYAASNPKEKAFFEALAGNPLKNSTLVAFGCTRRAGIQAADDVSLTAILACKAPAATLVGKAWDLHVTDVLVCSLDENLAICADSVALLKKNGLEVAFDAEHFYDAYKNNPEYALKVLASVAESGADVLVLCDTNGGSLPHEIYEITKVVCRNFSPLTVGIHTHNDTDCATANSLAAVHAGARQVQGTINGLGERCGNANLCALIPNLAFKMHFKVLTPDSIRKLTEVSRFVFEVANLSPVMNMPYVGESAFAHKGGLHVDGLRKNRRTYEQIEPRLVGNESRFLISELSGKSGILAQFEKTSISTDKKLASHILKRVQELENSGYQFETADGSFHLLIMKTTGAYKPFFELLKYYVTVERRTNGEMVNEATVKIMVGDQVEHVVGEGDGPVNALDAALRKALEKFYPSLADMHLVDYKVRVVNAKAGTAARVRVLIESRDKTGTWGTVGVSENIIEASWQALVDSVEFKLEKDAASKT